MLFGSFIARLGETQELLPRLVGAELQAEVAAIAPQFDETPTDYLRGAAQRFSAQASGAEWMGLMRILERKEETTLAALRFILRWSLERDRSEVSPGSGRDGSG